MATSGGRPQDIVNIYSRIFPSEARFGNLFLSTVVIAAQELCATVLALAVLVIGAMLFARSRQPSQETK
jgi:hypothetical protein